MYLPCVVTLSSFKQLTILFFCGELLMKQMKWTGTGEDFKTFLSSSRCSDNASKYMNTYTAWVAVSCRALRKDVGKVGPNFDPSWAVVAKNLTADWINTDVESTIPASLKMSISD